MFSPLRLEEDKKKKNHFKQNVFCFLRILCEKIDSIRDNSLGCFPVPRTQFLQITLLGSLGTALKNCSQSGLSSRGVIISLLLSNSSINTGSLKPFIKVHATNALFFCSIGNTSQICLRDAIADKSSRISQLLIKA